MPACLVLDLRHIMVSLYIEQLHLITNVRVKLLFCFSEVHIGKYTHTHMHMWCLARRARLVANYASRKLGGGGYGNRHCINTSFVNPYTHSVTSSQDIFIKLFHMCQDYHFTLL